jgi:hypothetical protein
MANGNGQYQTFRSWLADLRLKFNQEIDALQARLDEMEQQSLKSKPSGSIQDPAFELDLKGKP